MFRKWISRCTAGIVLLLVAAYIGLEIIPDSQLGKIWTKQQGEDIEMVLIGGIIGFGALLIILIVSSLPVNERRDRDHGDKMPPTHPSKTPFIEQLTGAQKEAGESNFANRDIDTEMSIITGHAQHIGEREEQQDAYACSSLEDSEAINRHGVLAVLADGMGGYDMGKEAGQLAVQVMMGEYTRKSAEDSIPRALEQSLHLANKAVYELALINGLEWSVGTTLISTVVHQGQLYWISAGDSRIYLYRGGALIPLTRDHVYANRLQEQVLAGMLTQEEADSHPERHLLTSYLGIPRITEINANHIPLRLLTGDLVILCSDGLYDDLSEKLLEEASCLHPPHAASFILQHVLAKQRPYQDNATITILACV